MLMRAHEMLNVSPVRPISAPGAAPMGRGTLAPSAGAWSAVCLVTAATQASHRPEQNWPRLVLCNVTFARARCILQAPDTIMTAASSERLPCKPVWTCTQLRVAESCVAVQADDEPGKPTQNTILRGSSLLADICNIAKGRYLTVWSQRWCHYSCSALCRGKLVLSVATKLESADHLAAEAQ